MSHFFNGSVHTKLDDKGRFVLPQNMRFGLVENGELSFSIALGIGGALTLYKRSDMEKIVSKFKKKQHIAKYQKFFTLFFSTLHHGSCDKLGRANLPKVLRDAVGIDGEIVIAGVLDKIEIWPKRKYEENLSAFLESEGEGAIAEVFATLGDEEPLAPLSREENVEYQEI